MFFGRFVSLFFASLFVFCLADRSAYAQESSLDERGQQLVRNLFAGEHGKVFETFDGTMKLVLPESKLDDVVESMLQQFGKFESIESGKQTRERGYDVFRHDCKFESGKVIATISFDSKQRVAGLLFSSGERYSNPEYAVPDRIDEVDVAIGKGFFKLSGTLTLPKGIERPPVVILVHGSGPHDRDESIGPNKPFRDLSFGLAAHGIAVLRYEKRSKEHPLALVALASKLTVKEETIHDAVQAFELLKSNSRINTDRIYILGHSLGGNVMPRIAAETSGSAGYIFMAASARPLEDLILDQTKTILARDGETTEADQKAIDEVAKQVELVKSDKLTSSTPSASLPLSIPAAYWLDLRDYDPIAKAKEIQRPMLFLQGERDYQVTLDDWKLWKQGLGDSPLATFRLFPKLNHLFLAGEGPSVPAEYNTLGHIPAEVIQSIADWIKQSN